MNLVNLKSIQMYLYKRKRLADDTSLVEYHLFGWKCPNTPKAWKFSALPERGRLDSSWFKWSDVSWLNRGFGFA